jgi:hypothetical protein
MLQICIQDWTFIRMPHNTMTTHTVETLMALAYKLRYAKSASYARVSEEALRTALTEALAQPVREPIVTGWDNGLSQDYDKDLGSWFAGRPGAKHQVRETFAQPVQVPLTDAQIQEIYISEYNKGHHWRDFENLFARAIERAHHIGGDK